MLLHVHSDCNYQLIVKLKLKDNKEMVQYLPAEFSLARICSDMVILEEEEAVRMLEYKTLHAQMISPMIDCLSKDGCLKH